MAASPPVEFSLSELEQAGLLDYIHAPATEISSPPLPPRSPPSAFRDRRSLSVDTQWPTRAPAAPVGREQIDLSRHATEPGQLQQRLDSGAWAMSPHELNEQQADARNARADSGRNQANNREHQRRFRARQKAKAQAVEAQLLKTTAELQQAKARQQQLELLLQQATISGSAVTTPKAIKEVQVAEVLKPGSNADGTPLLTISLHSKQTHMTTEQITELSIPQFCSIWADYIRQIGACLLDLHDHTKPEAKGRLHQLSFEAIRIVGRRLRLNPTGHRALITSDARSPSHAAGDKLKPQFYVALLRLLDLSEEQLEDMMLLRKLYVTKRHLLSVRREQLMASTRERMPHAIENVTRMSDLASQLKDNASEDHQLLYMMSRAFFCGILTMKQAGEVMVHSYPKMPVLEEMLNTFASQRGAETEESLVALAREGDLQAEWTTFWNYTRYVNPDYTARFEYVPLRELSCEVAGHQAARSMPAAPKPTQQHSSSSSGGKSLDLY